MMWHLIVIDNYEYAKISSRQFTGSTISFLLRQSTVEVEVVFFRERIKINKKGRNKYYHKN